MAAPDGGPARAAGAPQDPADSLPFGMQRLALRGDPAQPGANEPRLGAGAQAAPGRSSAPPSGGPAQPLKPSVGSLAASVSAPPFVPGRALYAPQQPGATTGVFVPGAQPLALQPAHAAQALNLSPALLARPPYAAGRPLFAAGGQLGLGGMPQPSSTQGAAVPLPRLGFRDSWVYAGYADGGGEYPGIVRLPGMGSVVSLGHAGLGSGGGGSALRGRSRARGGGTRCCTTQTAGPPRRAEPGRTSRDASPCCGDSDGGGSARLAAGAAGKACAADDEEGSDESLDAVRFSSQGPVGHAEEEGFEKP